MDLEMETIRKVMLEQEAVFRQQVQELHRVYEVQKRLMQEGKTLDLSSTDVKNTVKTEGNIATTTATRRRTFDLERPAEEYMDVEMEEPINSKASKVLDLGLGKNLNSSSFTQAATGSINRNRDGETEILQMIKRARSSEEPFSSSSSYASGFLGGLWGLGLEQKNGVRVPNGFHVDEKGTKENHVFLEGKLMDSMNPFYTGERDEHASKYASFNKLQNHVSYSSQGILIPSSSGNNSRSSSSSFLEPGLGLWWKSSNPSFYHQGQYQQVAVLQTPGAAQAAWQTSAFNSGSSPYHLQAMLSGRTPSTGENGTSWLKNGNGACANGFQFSSSTPPKPPPGKDFKGFPKLILDNATMELKLAPAENRPCIGFLRTAQNSSESEPEQCRKVELGIVDTGEEQKGTEIPPQDTVKQELLEGGKLEVSGAGKLGLADLNAPGCVEKGEAGALEALEPKCTEEEAQEGLNESEVVQDGLLQSCRRREEDAPSSLAAKHSPEEEQEQTQQQQRSSSGKKSEQESAEPSSASSTRKRRFKLVSSKDFSTARDLKKTEETEIEPEVEKKRRKSLSHSKPGKSSKPGEQSPRRNSDMHDDGANLAAEILVSLAPGPKLRQPEKNGVVRNHHKSKRRLIDTLSTDTPKTSSKPTPEPPSGKDTKKKKKKKSGKTEEGHHHHQHKVSIKSVKLAVTRSEVSEEAPKSSSKQKKNSKQPNQNHTLRSSPRPTREGPRQHGTVKGSTTTTLNVVISKTSGGTAVNKNHHRNEKKNNNTHSEHESLDRFSHSAVENSSEDNLGKDGEDVQDSIWARSWGPVVRKKRMTRVKRSGL